MSWASRRRTSYVIGVSLLSHYNRRILAIISVSPTCSDGIKNQGETTVDQGGPCLVLDERTLQPHSTLWSRSFRVRDGSYNAVAYVYNHNKEAGVRRAYYRFGLYDSQNVLVAERRGTTFILPGAITPVLESRIDTGNRTVSRTYFEFTDTFIWERMINTSLSIAVNNKELSNTAIMPRLSASVENHSVADVINLSFVAVIFDPAECICGICDDARASRQVQLRDSLQLARPVSVQVGRIDISPLVAPSLCCIESIGYACL